LETGETKTMRQWSIVKSHHNMKPQPA
jgi:hypothetical protein